MHSTDIGTARTDTVRRHDAAERQPSTATAMAMPVSVTQIHISPGAGSPDRPLATMNQYVAPVRPRPTAAATGSDTVRHRRLRHPTANTSNTAASAWATTGTQPCISETWSRNSPKGAARIVASAIVVDGVTPTIVT